MEPVRSTLARALSPKDKTLVINFSTGRDVTVRECPLRISVLGEFQDLTHQNWIINLEGGRRGTKRMTFGHSPLEDMLKVVEAVKTMGNPQSTTEEEALSRLLGAFARAVTQIEQEAVRKFER